MAVGIGGGVVPGDPLGWGVATNWLFAPERGEKDGVAKGDGEPLGEGDGDTWNCAT